jgi:dTDP-4-amino-4,6-dideoxygalactose transaminase
MPATTGLTIPFLGLRKQYHDLREEILSVTDQVLRSGQLMNGNNTAEFEHWLARRNGVSYAVTCHSGTQALEIIARRIAEDHALSHPTVLIPAMTYVATANAFANAGWNLHFVDVDNHGLLDKRKLPELTSYDAVVLIGLYGASITHWGNERIFNEWNHADVAIVEDAAQHWLAADSVRLGLASAVSFDPMKNLACYGNGGAVLTQHRDLAEYARSWRDNGRANNHANSASNSRISELDCAQLLVKTKYIDQWQARRRKIANYWIERIESSSIRCLIDQTNAHDHAYHKFVIEVDNRDQLRSQLADKKIETKVHYERPLHELDGIFRQYAGPGILSAASALARRALSLPLYPELTDLEVEYVIDQVLALV